MTREKEYRIICDKLACISCPDDKLRAIKELFVNEIDSARRYDRINNIANLLRILEKRDSLNNEHIDPLKDITVVLGRVDIITLIDAYNTGPQVLLNEVPSRNREEEEEFRVIPQIPDDPIERVYDLICTNIGSKWKDLARKLKVPEGKIDELEFRYKQISDMVREVLRFHRRNSDERYWKVDLCNGLTEARRRDLAIEVSRIFAMHYLM